VVVLVAVGVAVGSKNTNGNTVTGTGSTPTSSATFATDPNGQQCTSLASNGYCAGDGPSPTAPPTSSGPSQLAVGQPLMVSQGGGTTTAATVTVTKVTVTTQPADPSFGSPPQNGYYIIATVTVTASQDGFDINTLDFYCLTHGHHYDEGNGNAFQAVSNPADITGTLNSGETATGQEVFDVPYPHGKIVYAPNFQGGALAYWTY
jgi:hypothetical protein